MQENQNTNEQAQTKEVVPAEAQAGNEPLAPETQIPPSAEIKEEAPTLSTQPSNIEPQTQSMEVHKHPHHVMHSKKWHEYLLEFFMLFFAVFLGFVAENIRESSVERHREREYIITLLEDIKLDSINLDKSIRFRILQNQRIDTLLEDFHKPDRQNFTSDIYFLARWLIRSNDFYYNDRTIQQLKNAGGLRLIKNEHVSDSIILYDRWARIIQDQQHAENEQRNNIWHAGATVFDPYIFAAMEVVPQDSIFIVKPQNNPPLLTGDPKVIYQFLMPSVDLKQIYKVTARMDKQFINFGSHLKELINKEYRLEN